MNKTIELPTIVVYFQAALLGVSSLTFFVFGIFVGQTVHWEPTETQRDVTRKLTGRVLLSKNDEIYADAGAVVVLLPRQPKSIQRQNPMSLHPNNFEPLENPAIESLRSAGGDVVRTNTDGKFEFMIKPGDYVLLVVSNSSRHSSAEDELLSKIQIGILSQYFLPVESLHSNQDLHWQEVQISDSDVNIGRINFDLGRR